jgi:ABC-type glycerol-3-phosphate transport system substrate-binding protein
MRRIASATLASLSLLAACGTDTSTTPASAPPKSVATPPPTGVDTVKAPAETPNPPVEAPKRPVDIDEAYKNLMAKAEQPDEHIEIQHVLIAFKGAPRMTRVTRSKDEARALAQQVFDEALAGGDFLALVKKYTDDSAPGIYPMTKAGRASMVRSFGDVGFRLKVGEIGIATWNAQASPFGWHIIKRLK